MMTATRRSILAALLIGLIAPQWSCAQATQRATSTPTPTAAATTQAARPLRVLFIGNSYTAYNGGVDAVLQAMAKSRGHAMECVAATSGGKTLEWHWEEGKAREAIASGPWDYVVLQDYSTRPIIAPELMYSYVRRFDAEIREAGARTVLYSTWARFHQPENQIVIARAYSTIGKELGAIVARVGPAWERMLQDKPAIKLHMEDRSHPTPAGTYLAACVFYAALLNESPEALPSTVQTAGGKSIEVDPADAKTLQRAAARTQMPKTPASEDE